MNLLLDEELLFSAATYVNLLPPVEEAVEGLFYIKRPENLLYFLLNENGNKEWLQLGIGNTIGNSGNNERYTGTALVFNETDKSITLPELTGGTQGDVPIKGIKTIDGDELVPSTPDKIVTLPQLGDKNLIEKIKTSDGKDLPINEKSVTLPKTENFEIVNELPSTPNKKFNI